MTSIIGDIVYSLATVRALGGGTLLLDISGGASEPFVLQTCRGGPTKFRRSGYDTIRPLLVQQPYIDDVRIWTGEKVDFNLDGFRARTAGNDHLNLVASHLLHFGLSTATVDQPWLTVRDAPLIPPKPVIVNRTVRFHSKYLWWVVNIGRIAPNAVFVGLEKEHDVFQYTFDCTIDHRKTIDALEIARLLLGAQCLIGNQSFVMALAIGLGIPYLQEVYDYIPNCRFTRANGQYF
jgi:hypothetical protein